MRHTVEASCIVEIEQTVHSLHAHAIPQGVDVRPGDVVLVHGAPTRIGFGDTLRRECRVTVRRAGPLARMWTRAVAVFSLTTLYEVGFEPQENA